MGDAPSAIQEALQRARQLAAKITQNAPHIKRPAAELEEHSIGTVKVTLAYEKPANQPDNNNHQHQQQHHHHHSSSSSSSNHHSRESGSARRDSSRSSRDRDRERSDRGDREHDRDRDRDRSRDKERSDRNSREPSEYSGSSNYGRGNYNNHNNNNEPSQSTHSDHGAPNDGYGGGGGATAESKIEIIIPHAVIGLVIGKGGENIKRIQNETRAIVRVDPSTVDEKGNKVCTITGSKQAVEEAHNQVTSVIENAANNKRPRLSSACEGSDTYRMKIPAYRTGAIIGKGGETIKNIKQQSGCDIELDRNAKECGPEESIFIIKGTQDKILRARAMIEARLASRGRDNDSSGGRPGIGGGGGGGGLGGSSSKGVATGANAAPVAQYTDLPTGYQAAAGAGQQTSADVSAAWAAYFAQYSNMFNPTGAQPGAAAGNPAGMPYATATGMMAGATMAQQLPGADHQQAQQQPPQQPMAPAANKTQGQQQDYTEQWIEFYLMNGRPDYAEQIREMKKQQQAGQQKTPQV